MFTDRRAYVNALSYEIETSDSASSKASKQKELAEYKRKQATVEFPDGSKKPTTRFGMSARKKAWSSATC